MLPAILQQIAATNPALMEAIQAHQEDFVALMNAPPVDAQGAPVNAGNVADEPNQIALTEADRNAIDRVSF